MPLAIYLTNNNYKVRADNHNNYKVRVNKQLDIKQLQTSSGRSINLYENIGILIWSLCPYTNYIGLVIDRKVTKCSAMMQIKAI